MKWFKTFVLFSVLVFCSCRTKTILSRNEEKFNHVFSHNFENSSTAEIEISYYAPWPLDSSAVDSNFHSKKSAPLANLPIVRARFTTKAVEKDSTNKAAIVHQGSKATAEAPKNNNRGNWILIIACCVAISALFIHFRK